jgi:chromosome partitioning protein
MTDIITIRDTPAPARQLTRTIRILCAGAKGGPGKSFMAKSFAGAAASEGYVTAIVDFDKQRTSTRWLQRRQRLYSDGPFIESFEADPYDPQDAATVMGLDDFDIIFIDTPPAIDQHGDVLKTLAFKSDLVLVPTKVGISDTESTESLLRALATWKRPTLTILNQVKPKAAKAIGRARKRLIRDAELCAVEIGEFYDFLAADEVGMGATEMAKCTGADTVAAVWEAVKRKANIRMEAR